MRNRIIVTLLLLLISPITFAAPSVFTIPGLDQSMLFLGQVFGQVGPIIAGNANNPLRLAILAFNNAALVIGGIIIIYALIVSTLNTAHEGEMLGKKWNSVWIPLRMAAGFALLLPVKSGAVVGSYAVIQVMIMWIVVQGVGAADYIWTQYLKAVATGTATVQPMQVPAGTALGSATSMFINASCMYAYADAMNCSNNIANPTCPTVSGSTGAPAKAYISPVDPNKGGTATFGVQAGDGTFISACGQVTIPDNTSSPSNVRAAQNAILMNMINSVQETANTYHNLNYCFNSDGTTVDKSCIASAQRGIINASIGYAQQMTAENAFATTTQENANAWQQAMSGQSTQQGYIVSELAQAQQYGWIYAGTYYILLAKATAQAMPPLQPIFVQPPTLTIPNNPSFQQYQQEILLTAQTCQSNGSAFNPNGYPCIPQSISTGGPASTAKYAPINTGGLLGPLLSSVNSIFSVLFGWFTNAIYSGASTVANNMLQNPIVMLAQEGQVLVGTIAITYSLFGAVLITIGAATGWIPFVGNDITSSIMNALLLFVVPVMGLLGTTMGFAALAGYYLPLVPFILFTAGAVSWLILVIEAMVAGPIIALGIVHPEGQHDVFGRAERAIFMLVSLCLRPALMVVGFIAASIIVFVAAQLLVAGYRVAFSFATDAATGPFALMFYFGTFTSLLVFLMNRCFTLIHAVPDKLLRWIGESPESTGGEAEKHAQEGGEKTSQKGSKGLESGTGAGKGVLKSVTDKNAADKSAADSAKKIGDEMSKRKEDGAGSS